MIFNNFKQLKDKLTVGMTITLTYARFSHENLGEKIKARLNQPREIIKKQTNAIQFSDGSYLGLGSTGEKAKDFLFFGNNTFSYRDDDCILDYRVGA